MTLERRVDAGGNLKICTVECPLCGEPINDHASLSLHIRRTCPARERYAKPGALRNGGPDQVATDGGEQR